MKHAGLPFTVKQQMLTVLAPWPWLKHGCPSCGETEHGVCYTARGEPVCTCGFYQLFWQEPQPEPES